MPSVTVPGVASSGVTPQSPTPTAGAPAPSGPQRGPTQYLPGPGQVSLDYSGSYDEWRQRAVADLIRRYTQGLGGKGSDDPELGNPSPEDFGSAANGSAGEYSFATVQYWERFIDKYGATDPFVAENYGPPPGRRATYTADPNSNSAINDRTIADNAANREFTAGQNDKDREFSGNQAALDRQHALDVIAAQQAAAAAAAQADRDWQTGENALDHTFQSGQADLDRGLAREREAAETARITAQITSNEKITAIDDATRRYIAEGDWGTQKLIVEAQEKGALDRLTLELGQRDEELAQRALEAKNQHQATMVGLVLQVAQIDTELAAQPINWLKYASWLKSRGEVVDGMTLAMASEQVPENAIDPRVVANSGIPGGNVAAQQTFEERMTAGAGAIQELSDPNANAAALAAQNAAGTGPVDTQQTSATTGTHYKGIDLEGTDYGKMLDQILGLGGNPAVDGVDNSQANIQATLDSLNTQGNPNPGQQSGGFSLNGNAFQFNGQGDQQDYRKFAKLLPGQQQMNLGAAKATGSSVEDYLYKMQKTKPQGAAVAGASYG